MKNRKVPFFVDKISFLLYYYSMKKITTDQMNKLKGKLGQMDYNEADQLIVTTVSTPQTQEVQTTVCKAKASLSDE